MRVTAGFKTLKVSRSAWYPSLRRRSLAPMYPFWLCTPMARRHVWRNGRTYIPSAMVMSLLEDHIHVHVTQCIIPDL